MSILPSIHFTDAKSHHLCTNAFVQVSFKSNLAPRRSGTEADKTLSAMSGPSRGIKPSGEYIPYEFRSASSCYEYGALAEPEPTSANLLRIRSIFNERVVG